MIFSPHQIIIFDEDKDLFELVTQKYEKDNQVILKPLNEIKDIKNYINNFIIVRDCHNQVTQLFTENNFFIKLFKEKLLFILKDSIKDFNFLCEPIKIVELFILIEKALSKINLNELVTLKPYVFYDYKKQKIYIDKEEILLSEKENLIIKYLYDIKNAVSKDQLLRDIWQYKEGVNTHTVETHIYRIRAKTKNDLIITTKDGNYELSS